MTGLTLVVIICTVPRFEDHAALDGGTDGLRVIRQILTLAPKILCKQG